MSKKSMVLALILSFLLPGLGLVYTKEYVKGIIMLAVAVVVDLLAIYVNTYINIISVIILIYALYCTYQSVKAWNANEA